MNLRDLILSSGDVPPVAVETPNWKCPRVWVRVMTAAELMGYYDALSRDGAETTHRGELLARCLCDEQGTRLFTDDDVEAINALPHTRTDRLHRVAARLNRLTKKAKTEAEKNSDARRFDSSGRLPSDSE